MTDKLKNKNEPQDELDVEVDELLELARSGQFEPGIYNYCDRWCERCQDTKKCYLFAQEQKSKAQKLILDQEAASESAWLEDVEHNFAITHRLLERKFKEQGIDLDKIMAEAENIKSWDDDATQRYDKVPCYKLAKKYLEEVHSFLDKFHQNRFEYYSTLGLEVDYSDIKDEIEAITWYFTMMPTKIWRYYYEKESCQREKDRELKELMNEDLGKFRALVEKCINQSFLAWKSLSQKKNEWLLNCQYFMESLEKIKQKLD